jgi:hypothetical protein
MFTAILILLIFFKPNDKTINEDLNHGLDEYETKVLTFLAAPGLPGQVTPKYVAHMLGTHEINIRKAAKSLEQKRLILFAHASNTRNEIVTHEEWWLILLEKGREFLGKNKLLD